MTKVLDGICKIRDLCDEGDLHKLERAIPLINTTLEYVQRYTQRFITRNDRPDFLSGDLLETANDIKPILEKVAEGIDGAKYIEEINRHEVVDDEVILKWTAEVSDMFALRAVLTKAHSIFTFLGTYLTFLEKERDQEEDIGYVLTQALEGFLNKRGRYE